MHNSPDTPSSCPAENHARTQSATRNAAQILMLAALVHGALLTGCGEPEIDATSDRSMQASIAHIRSMLNSSERARFDTALTDLNNLLFNTTDAVSQATISLYRPDALIRKILHGKTAREVIDMVDEHRQ